MLRIRSALITLCLFVLCGVALSQPAVPQRLTNHRSVRNWDTQSDTWAATDALGRQVPGFDLVGPPRIDRFIGVFYFLWLGSFPRVGPYDVTQILKQDPTAMLNPASPLWGAPAAPHHWGQSLFGYYLNDDEYVLRRHAQMLSDAGVDVIIFDTSNDVTYKSQYMKLLQVFSAVRAEGGKTPQIAFLCPFWDPGRVVRELVTDLYGTGLYRDLWFKWRGKPLILAEPNEVGDHNPLTTLGQPKDLEVGKPLAQKFTATKPFRTVGARTLTYGTAGTGMTLSLYRGTQTETPIASKKFTNVPDNKWVNLEFSRPLPPGDYVLQMSEPKGHLGWWTDNGKPLFGGSMTVNREPQVGALSLTIEATTESGKPITDLFTFRAPQPSYFDGPTKKDMWSWLEVYPQHVFPSSTRAKEQMSVGVAQNAVGSRLGSMSEHDARGRNWHDGKNDERKDAVDWGLNFQEQAERALKEGPEFIFITGWNEWIAGRFSEFAGVKEPVMFVDEFTQERSRDIEPMMGGHGDNYYYQMVSFIRRYKGATPISTAGHMKSIDVDGDFRQWRGVEPTYRDDIGDSAHRDHPGWNPSARYTDNTGRNDFVSMKVSRDEDSIMFYVQTKDPITPITDPHWMMLFINVGEQRGGNWNGYQFVLNRKQADAQYGVLEQSTGGWNWREKARVRYRVQGNEMQITIPRSALGLQDLSKPLHLEFKWVDNMQHEGDITDFGLHGDAAPNGRFNYVFIEK